MGGCVCVCVLPAYLLLVQLSKTGLAAAVVRIAAHVNRLLLAERLSPASPGLPIYQRSIKPCEEVVIVSVNLGEAWDLPTCRPTLQLLCLAHASKQSILHAQKRQIVSSD